MVVRGWCQSRESEGRSSASFPSFLPRDSEPLDRAIGSSGGSAGGSMSAGIAAGSGLVSPQVFPHHGAITQQEKWTTNKRNNNK